MKPFPRVVCDIDGSTLPMQDYSFTSVVNGGYHEFRGQAPWRKLLALDASQEAPLTVWHEETGDVLWAGRFVTDPEMEEGVGFISATGPKAELEKMHTRLFYQSRDVRAWTQATSSPHAYAGGINERDLSVEVRDGSLLYRLIINALPVAGDSNAAVFWAPGGPSEGAAVTRYGFDWISSGATTQLDLRGQTMIGPQGAGSVIGTHSLNATSGTVDQVINPGFQLDQLYLELRVISNIASNPVGVNWVVRNLRVNGIADDDTFLAHEVLRDLGGRVGFNTALIESSGLNVLPLDWMGSWASLADYIVALLDWRWLVSTVPVPGTGLVNYLEAGPWEKEWTLTRSGTRPRLKPQQRRNEAVVTYRDVGGADREVRVRANPDPLAKYGVVRSIGASLADVQADATLATAVATTLAQRHSQKILTGDIDAADVRDDVGRGDARLVKPGDIGRIADWGPSEETFHRIHGTEQTQTSVRYSIEAPITEFPLTEAARLLGARMPGTAQLPELEPVAVEPSGIPSEEQQHRDRFLTWPQGFPKRGTGHGRG